MSVKWMMVCRNDFFVNHPKKPLKYQNSRKSETKIVKITLLLFQLLLTLFSQE